MFLMYHFECFEQVVIMGDTCSGDAIAELAEGADVLVHEATNTWLREQVTTGTYTIE